MVCFFAVILGDPSYMLFYLTPTIQPHMLVTFNADLEPLTVTVRVGQVGVQGFGGGGVRVCVERQCAYGVCFYTMHVNFCLRQ